MAAIAGTFAIQVVGTLFYGILFQNIYVERMRMVVNEPFGAALNTRISRETRVF